MQTLSLLKVDNDHATQPTLTTHHSSQKISETNHTYYSCHFDDRKEQDREEEEEEKGVSLLKVFPFA